MHHSHDFWVVKVPVAIEVDAAVPGRQLRIGGGNPRAASAANQPAARLSATTNARSGPGNRRGRAMRSSCPDFAGLRIPRTRPDGLKTARGRFSRARGGRAASGPGSSLRGAHERRPRRPALRTSTSAKSSAIWIAPTTDPGTPASLVIAPTRSPGRIPARRPPPTKSWTHSPPPAASPPRVIGRDARTAGREPRIADRQHLAAEGPSGARSARPRGAAAARLCWSAAGASSTSSSSAHARAFDRG